MPIKVDPKYDVSIKYATEVILIKFTYIPKQPEVDLTKELYNFIHQYPSLSISPMYESYDVTSPFEGNNIACAYYIYFPLTFDAVEMAEEIARCYREEYKLKVSLLHDPKLDNDTGFQDEFALV